MSPSTRESKTVVAMSGGVDSSVAAMLLNEQGHNVVGISMQVWDYRKNGGCSSKATCCSPDDFTDARKVAAKIGVPYYVFDFERTFREEVIDKFIDSYASGRTPNPCVECNNKVKFRELRDRAKTLDCDYVATGHYARLDRTGGRARLLRGKDREKDQSYFLYGLSADELETTIFPVGDMLKEEVRSIARDAGLSTAEKPESQDICFVSGTVQEFLHTIGKLGKKGDLVTSSGRKIGEHDGIHNFTVGQRRGLNVGGCSNPLYVLEIDADNNRIIVGEKHELERPGFQVAEVSWLTESVTKPFECIVQMRSRHRGVRARVSPLDDRKAQVSFLGEWGVASPGQAAVFYDLSNEQVLGGGKISELS